MEWVVAREEYMCLCIPFTWDFDVVLSKVIVTWKNPCISVNQCLRHNLGYKQKIIQVIQRIQVYFSSSNVSTDTAVIVKD